MSDSVATLQREFHLTEREAFRHSLWAYCSADGSVPQDWLAPDCPHTTLSVSGVELGMSEVEVTRVLGAPEERVPRSASQQVRGLSYDNGPLIRFLCGRVAWCNGTQLFLDGKEMVRTGASDKEIPPELGQVESTTLWREQPEFTSHRLYFLSHDLEVAQSSDGLVTGISQGDRLLRLSKEPRIKKDELLALIESELAEIKDPEIVSEIREHLIRPYAELRDWDYDHRCPPVADHEYWMVLKVPNPKFAIAYTRDAFGGGIALFPWGLVPVVADGFDQDSLWSPTLEEAWRNFGPR